VYGNLHSLAFEVYTIAVFGYSVSLTTVMSDAFSSPLAGKLVNFILRFAASGVSWSVTWSVKSIVPVPVIACSNDSDSGTQLWAVAFIVTMLSLLSAPSSSTA